MLGQQLIYCAKCIDSERQGALTQELGWLLV